MKSITKRNGGFTLVELVVAVAILGIITAIALPTIGNLKNKNERKKYVSYENSITSSAKLYIDQYEEDVFNKKDANQQCKSITYGDLKNHNLLKDYNLDNVTCSGIGDAADPNDDKIVAYVVKDSSGNYKYYPRVTCQKDGKEVFRSIGTLPLSCEKTKDLTAKITTSDTCFYQSNNEEIDISIKQIEREQEYDLYYALIDLKSARNPDAIEKLKYTKKGSYKGEQTKITIDVSECILKEEDYKEYKLVLMYTFGDNEEPKYVVVNKTIRVDYAKPIMEINAKKSDDNSDYKGGSWTNQDVTLSATAKNNCGKTIEMKESSSGEKTITVSKEGKHTVEFTTPYGNNKQATASIDVNIDKTAPTVEIAYGNTTKTYTGDNKKNVFDISNVASITDKSAKAEIDKIKWYKNDINYSVKITDKYTIGTTKLIKNVIRKSPTDSEKAKNEQQSKAIEKTFNKEINVLKERTVSLEDTGYRQGWYMVEDMAGNKTSVRLTAALDQEKPTSPTSTISTTKINQTKQTSYNGTWTNQTTNWKEFNSSDQSYGSGVSGIYYREDGQNDWKIVDNSYTFNNIDKKFYLKSVDKAGNESTASGPYIFKVDQIAPTCETTYSGGYNGEWTSKDVILVGVCHDNASGCTSETQNVSKKLTKSESSTASPGVVKDVAGNKTTCPNKAYKIDKTTPRCSIAASGVQGDSSWYKSKVDLKLSAKTDGPSKIKYTLTNARTTQPSYDNSTAKQQAAETNGTNWYGYVENEAGTKNSCDIFIKVDTIAPTCQVNITSGTPGKNGWYTSNVALKLNRIEDNGSPIKGYGLSQGTTKNKYNSTTTGTQSDSTASGTTWYGYVKDEAGNEGSCKTSRAIKVDTTTPTCSIAARGTEGKNGWYKSDVTLTLDAQAKGASGISYDLTKSTTPTYNGNKQITQSSETTGTEIYGYVENKAGTSGKCETTVKIDKTVPTCNISVSSGTKGDNNWYKSNVGLVLNKSDTGGSNLAGYKLTTSATAGYDGTSITNSQTTDTNTNGQTWYGYVKDNAGNVNKCSINIKVDKTKPTCKITASDSNKGDNGWYKGNVDLTLSNTESGSGLAGYNLTTSTSPTYSGKSLTATQSNNTRSQTWHGYVKDKAGNVNKCNITIKVDKDKPTCNITASGTVGDNNWYTSNVNLKMTKSDTGGSTVARYKLTTSSTPAYNGKSLTATQKDDTTSQTWHGYVKDKAGNINSCSIKIKKDAGKPNVPTSTVKVYDGLWWPSKYTKLKGYTTDWINDTIEWTDFASSDSTSGIEGIYYSKSGSTDGRKKLQNIYKYKNWNATYYIYAKDKAGNWSNRSKAFTFKVDTEAPKFTDKINMSVCGIYKETYYKFGYKFTDNLSGISTDNAYFKYCYDAGSEFSGNTCDSSGYSDADYNWERANAGSLSGDFLSGVSICWARKPSVKVIKAKLKICDRAGNCATKTKNTDYKPPKNKCNTLKPWPCAN